MHVLFVHQNFPAQFRCIARRLAGDHGWTCTFATQNGEAPDLPGVRRVLYRPAHVATARTPVAARPFENALGHARGVYEAMKARPDIRPDLIVAHSGFGSSVFLPFLYDAPIISFFEYLYRPVGQDLGYRPETPVTESMLLRSPCRNGMILMDWDACARGWCPNHSQRDLFPPELRGRIKVIPEGVDTRLYYRRPDTRLKMADGSELPEDTRVVTYVSRGFELMRGFDIFMKVAKRICEEMSNVIFVVVGSDRVCYGSEHALVREKTFGQHVLQSAGCDMSRFCFTGHVPEDTLAQVFSASDLHIYLTAPFVTSWSLLDAMACGCVVLASDQACTREYVTHGQNGLLGDFFDVKGLARTAVQVLKDPARYRHLGDAAQRDIQAEYSLDVSLPKIKAFFERVAATPREPSMRAEKLVRTGTLSARRRPRDKEAGGPGEVRPGLTAGLLASVSPTHVNSSTRRGQRILFCWELGRGLGHMVPMLPLAEALVKAGHRVSVALKDGTRAAEVFGAAGVSLLHAPHKSSGRIYFRRTLNFAHILANTAWGADVELAGLGCMWRNLLLRENPDLVIFDHSPMAMLAARCLPGRVKKVVTGLGFFCLPDVSPFPVLVNGEVDLEKLAADERRVLARANRLLAHWKRPPLERLGQLYGDVDDTCFQTFKELDHYSGRPEGTQYWGPVHALGGIAPQWPAGDGKRAFAYLKNWPAVGEVLEALAALGGPTIVLSDDIDGAVQKRFSAVRCMRFENRRLDMQRVREECDLAVHNANHGTTVAFLMAGKPSIHVPMYVEQRIVSGLVKRLGAGGGIPAEKPELLRPALDRLLADADAAKAARAFADRYRSFNPATAAVEMADRIETIGTRQNGP